MDILGFFFDIFKSIINLYNVDFFGLGFTWLNFILAALLIIFIVRFLVKAFFVSDSFNFFSLTGLRSKNKMSNRKRENFIVLSNTNVNITMGESDK